jgi:hypothetical protein
LEVSGQLHAPAALPPGKESPVPIGFEEGQAPEPVWMMWRGEKSCPYRESNSNPLAIQPVASRHTDCGILAHSELLIALLNKLQIDKQLELLRRNILAVMHSIVITNKEIKSFFFYLDRLASLACSHSELILKLLILYTVGRTPWMEDQPIAWTLNIQDNKHRINADRYPCLDSNPRPQCLNGV